jgi:hypothetical protein
LLNIEQAKKELENKELKSEEGYLLAIERLDEEKSSYIPLISILQEPSLFMALVPAIKALEVVKVIKKKYETEFSKVQNRLPLNISVIFAERRTPLYSVIEAGRKMIEGMKTETNLHDTWIVSGNNEADSTEICEKYDGGLGNKVRKLKLTKEGDKKCNKKFETFVSYSFGNPSPEKKDFYYPYFYTELADKDVQDRVHIFKAPLPEKRDDWKYLVHVSELEQGDKVYFTPSYFDFEFLEVVGRRFDIYYENNIRKAHPSKPFLLKDVEKIENVWKLIKDKEKLTDTQFRGILEVIETRREKWDAHSKDFREFVHYTLWAQAKGWMESLNESDRELITEWAVNGRLGDVAEFYLKILKQRIREEKV